jgi:sugar lactone lactonase YvrE
MTIRYMLMIAVCAALCAPVHEEARPGKKVSIRLFAGSPTEDGDVDGKGVHARFRGPSDMCVDKNGNLYVATPWSRVIRKVTPSGLVTTFAGNSRESGSVDGKGSEARLSGPTGIDADLSGNIYFTDSGNEAVRKITPDGLVSTVAGRLGDLGFGEPGYRDGRAEDARFKSPWGLAVDHFHNIYVADNRNCVIRKITPDRMVSTLAGLASKCRKGATDGIGPTATFDMPGELTVDGAENLYVVDGDHVIRKVTPTGVVSSFAGAFGQSGNMDGKGADARFNRIMGIDADASGNVYVADGENRSIRKITPDGTVTTLVRTPEYPVAVAYDAKRNRLFVAAGYAIYVVTF